MQSIRYPRQWLFVSAFITLLLCAGLVSTKTVRSYEGDPGGSTIPGPNEIIGFVYDDINSDGERTLGEPSLPTTLTVSLLNLGPDSSLGGGDDAVIQTTTTYTNGFYVFTGVSPQTYAVQAAEVPGYIDTSLNPVVVVVGVNGAKQHFGKHLAGSISGVVFNDRNGNGVRGTGEPGIGNVTITLDGTSTTTTAADGTYSFTGVAAGAHTVVETDPAGFVSTTPNRLTVSVSAGGSASVSFGNQPQEVISGMVFNDFNGNGAPDAGESGIGGVTVKLDGATATTTDSDGFYSFTGVSAGSHDLVETDPAGFVSTTPNNKTVSVSAGGSATANFGDQQQKTISGAVFNDLDGNGVQDAGESGISSVIVTLKQAISGATVATTYTTSSGAYAFVDVGPNSYTVEETDPVGFVSTTPNQVTVFVVADGSATANFGDQPRDTISGRVFNDLSGNGLQDAGESGIGGVIVTLDGITTTTTTGNGSYSFAGVGAGSHVVAEIDPSDFVSTTPNTVTVMIPVNGAGTANFGDFSRVAPFIVYLPLTVKSDVNISGTASLIIYIPLAVTHTTGPGLGFR